MRLGKGKTSPKGDIRSYFSVVPTSGQSPRQKSSTSSNEPTTPKTSNPKTSKRKAAQALTPDEEVGGQKQLVETTASSYWSQSPVTPRTSKDAGRRIKKPKEEPPVTAEPLLLETAENQPEDSASNGKKTVVSPKKEPVEGQPLEPEKERRDKILENGSGVQINLTDETDEKSERKVERSNTGDESNIAPSECINGSAKLKTEGKDVIGSSVSKKRSADKVEDVGAPEDHVPPPSKKKPQERASAETKLVQEPASESSAAENQESVEDKKRKNASNYFKFLSRGPPQNLGAKEFPEGAPNCLANLTFVLSGVLPSFERDDVADVISKYGGRVTGGVSKKTSYVVIGNDAGAAKTKKAETLGIPLISEDEFLEILRKSNPSGSNGNNEAVATESLVENSPENDVPVPSDKVNLLEPSICKNPEAVEQAPQESKIVEKKQTPIILTEADKGPKVPTPKDESNVTDVITKAKESGVNDNSQPSSSNSVTSVSSGSIPKPQTVAVVGPQMWVDKYKPTALKNIVGQVGDRSNAKKLLLWLQNWFLHHGSANGKAKANFPGLRDPDGKTFKAALLSGPPGVGKTTTAHLCCAELKYDYYEMNASDQRNKKGLHEGISDSLTNTTITFPSVINSLNKSGVVRKHVLIMDEVDGMSGNEDRGGVQELIALIKTSRIPIICICNDRNHQKIRSLANYCFDLRFTKPRNEQLKGFIQSICFKEKIKVPPETIQQLIVGTDQDVRQILHQLQMFQDSDSNPVYNPRKDLRLGPWDVIRKVFSSHEHSGMSVNDKASLFFQDYSMGPLFVQENYLRSIPTTATGKPHKLLSLVKDAAASLALGDIVDNAIRRNNAWSLLPVQAIFSSVLPGEYMEGTAMSGVDFPQWLGKNSNRNKRARLIQEVHNHVHLQISGSTDALNLDYLPYLRRSIVTPLSKGDIEDAAHRMTSYFLLRDDLESLNDLAMWPNMRDNLDKLDSKSKAAFTRLVNKESFVPYSVVKVSKGRGKGTAEGEDELDDITGEGEEEKGAEDEEDNEDVETDAMIKVKKPRANCKANAKPSSKSKNKK